MQVRVWNPKLYPSDRAHRMPIITPAYPSMCATHNVTASTQMIMKEEFKRGTEVMQGIMMGKTPWKDLFAKHDFFKRYNHYITVIVSSDSQEYQLKW